MLESTKWRQVLLGSLVRRVRPEKLAKGELLEPVFLVEYEDVASDVGLVVGGAEVEELSGDKHLLSGADLVYGKLEPDTGRCFVPPSTGKAYGSTELMPVKVDRDRALPSYLAAVLTSAVVRERLAYVKSGKCQQRADIDQLFAYTIPLPPIDVQERVVKRLQPAISQLTELIGTRRRLDVSRAIAEVFEKHFHHDEPRTSVLSTITANAVSASRLLRCGVRYASMSAEFERLVTKVGKTEPLGKYFAVRGGKRKKPGTLYALTRTPFRFLRGQDIWDGQVDEESLQFLSKEDFEAVKWDALRPGDIAMTIAGTVGKVAEVGHLGSCIISDNLAVISVRPGVKISTKFVLYLLSSSFVQFQLQKEMSELRQQKVSLEKLKLIRIPVLPDSAVQDKIVKDVQGALAHIHDVELAIDARKREIAEVVQELVA